MSEKKGWGSSVLGWFVVQEQEETSGDSATQPRSDDDDVIARASAGSAGSAGNHSAVVSTTKGAAAQPAFFTKAPPASVGGKIDYDGVFEAAGIDAEERGRVGKALDLLKSLPAGTDPAVKKQIVEASLKAFGVPIEKIIEAGVQEIQALEGYIRAGATDTQKLFEESQKRIHDYEEEIRRIKTVTDDRVKEQQSVVSSCNAKKLEVQHILEFFGQEAVARVVRDSPKLHDPSGSNPSPQGK